jgi:hypothetical protein
MTTKKIMTLLISLSFLVTVCRSQDLTLEIKNSLGEGVYKSFTCKLYSKILSSNSLFIMCNTGGANNYSNSFVIETKTLIQYPNVNEEDDYSVIIPNSKKYAILYNKTKSSISIIGVMDGNYASAKTSIRANAKLDAISFKEEFYGYGMSFLIGSWDIGKIKQTPYKFWQNILDYSDINNPSFASRLPQPGDTESVAPGGGPCTSGGIGSSACSTEGPLNNCSVTCIAGYYACCDDNRMKCYCVPNPPVH